jgi:hypothetical protein
MLVFIEILMNMVITILPTTRNMMTSFESRINIKRNNGFHMGGDNLDY